VLAANIINYTSKKAAKLCKEELVKLIIRQVRLLYTRSVKVVIRV